MIFLKPLANKIIQDNSQKAKVNAMKNDEEILKYLIDYFPRDYILKSFEEYYGVEYIDLSSVNISLESVNKFNIERLKEQLAIPYKVDETNKTIYFAINNIMGEEIRTIIENHCKSKGYQVRFAFAFKHEILEKYSQIANKGAYSKGIDAIFNAQEWVNSLISNAIRLNASDIHIERLEHGLQTRLRIDGVMTNKKVYNFDESIISNIYVRIKVISEMDISEARKPQDGKINNYRYGNSFYDLRVSTVNTVLGEKVVMRIFDKNSKPKTFKELGFSKEEIKKVEKMLKSRSGIVYMGGATGSGKTTTLYTMIDTINSDDINIYTIENPVEKTVESINQIQINLLAGVDYPSTLRALLRQDPDVIVVGEIRDTETADLSVRASLTGHLVLSTIHANSALDLISRLWNMDVEPYLISASTLGFLSQRLVRLLCPNCKQKVEKLLPYEKTWIEKLSSQYNLKSMGINLKESTFYKPVGCDCCHNGYQGRTAVIEVIEVTDELKKLISKKSDLSIIKKQALLEGFKPMAVNGLVKALNGETSIEEIIKQLN